MLRVEATIRAELHWSYEVSEPRLRDLYHRNEDATWSSDDVDWSIEVPYGEPLPGADARFLELTAVDSPLHHLGPAAVDVFRWEFQNWMVSQFLHGEQGALVAAARLVEVVPGIAAKSFAASQTADEARHVEVFSRYATDKLPHHYQISASLESWLADTLRDGRWDITQLGMHIIIEALAMASFRLGQTSFHDPLIRDLCARVARDEARHVAFGILSLEPAYDQMSSSELRDREEFVLAAANLMAERFLLTEIWERLDVDPVAGRAYARTSPMMSDFRRAVFAKVVTALRDVGLFTPRIRDELDRLRLLGAASGRRTRRSSSHPGSAG